MKNLIIDSTPNSPKISFKPQKSRFKISGESRPENASVFYKPVIDWVKELEVYFKQNDIQLNSPFIFNFNLEYFNSTSAKFILDFCKKLGHLYSLGHPIVVRWHYEEDDEDMLEVGQEMSRMSKFPFEFVKEAVR